MDKHNQKERKINMLSGNFENCYGLKNFKLKEINFTNSNKAIIYAPNGVENISC